MAGRGRVPSTSVYRGRVRKLLKKKLLSLVVAAAVFGLFGNLKQQARFALPFEGNAQAQTQSAQPGQMSETAFKNIQVLKGIPVDEFMGTMGLFTAALSYCCKDCHTGAGTSNPNWEADPPKKVIARRMIQMVSTINQQNFNGRQMVTCWTCHRGGENPAITPPDRYDLRRRRLSRRPTSCRQFRSRCRYTSRRSDSRQIYSRP